MKAEVSKGSPIYGRDRAEDVAGLFTHKNTRTTLGTVHHKLGWPIILKAIDSGLIVEPTNGTIESPTAMFLFPKVAKGPGMTALRKWRLDTPKGCKEIEETLLPALIEKKDELLANPGKVDQILSKVFRCH
jgi:hypothetical protein